MTRARGFTLVELMIALSVLAILLGLGVPSFLAAIRDNRATAAANDLVTALRLARSEAVKRRQNVVVCRRNSDGDACEHGANWAPGWIVFADTNGDGDRATNPPPGEPVVQLWNAPGGNPALTASANTVTFQSGGQVTAARSFTIVFPGCSDAQGRTVAVTATGRISTTRTACP